MRLSHPVCLSLLVCTSAALVGCQRSATQAPPAGTSAVAQAVGRPESAAGTPSEARPVAGNQPVPVKAYINVSSGCQQETVDLLNRMAAQDKRLALELIDFGSPDGSRRWRADGLNCLTILINGHETVTYGPRGKRQTVTFHYPPGFQWAHEDLQGALAGALDGTLYYGEEPGATRVESRMPTLRITSRETLLSGKKVGEVLVNGQVAIRVRTTFDGLPPLQRAEQAAARLKRALAAQFSPADIRVAKSNDGVAVAIGDKVLCIADGPQAAMLKTTPDKLAQGWASALKKALMAAAAK